MNKLLTVEDIKSRIQELYISQPNIHINVTIARPKITLKNVEAKILGVYKNVFTILEKSSGISQIHTLQYTDVYIKRIEILEMQHY